LVTAGPYGGLDIGVKLQQANSVYGLIECGSVPPAGQGIATRVNGYSRAEFAYNWAGCPAGQNWRGFGVYGGQVFDKYFLPQDGYPFVTNYIYK